MVRMVSGKELREGDWLAEDMVFAGKKFKADWEGISGKDLKILSKSKKKFKIKEGLPFVPAFLIAFILWIFRERVLNWVLGLI